MVYCALRSNRVQELLASAHVALGGTRPEADVSDSKLHVQWRSESANSCRFTRDDIVESSRCMDRMPTCCALKLECFSIPNSLLFYDVTRHHLVHVDDITPPA
jgi:hypothetical protein